MSTSRLLNAGAQPGCVGYLGQFTLSGATLTSPTFDLNADNSIGFEGSVKANASGTIDFFLNSDTTSANYDRAVTSNSGSTPTSATANNSLIATVAAGDVVRFQGKLFKDVEGHPCVEMSYSQLSTTSLKSSKVSIVWRTTGANVTSLKFQQSTGSLSSGSGFVFKKSPLIALNSGNLDCAVNPSNPIHMQRARRTDLAIGPLWIYYDATLGLWLTEDDVPLYGTQITTQALSATAIAFRWNTRADYRFRLTRFSLTTYINGGTINSTNKWVNTLLEVDASNSTISTDATIDCGSDASVTWTNHDTNLSGGITVSASAKTLNLTCTKSGVPGNLYAIAELRARLIIP